MLRITMNKSAGGAKKYYSEEYYREGVDKQHDYYAEKEQTIGRWGGKGAEKLDLRDAISKSDFGALCDNQRPDNGKTLTGRTYQNRSVGYDFTFNCSKSVSLAYSFANEKDKREILAAFHQSVADTMNEIEKGMQARVRDKGKNENRETGNIVYGEFTHFTSRPVDGVPDPHLHSHCFVFNATYDEHDNKWKAGQFRQVKQDAPYYEAHFHSQFANRLQQLGYSIEKTQNGFELKGISKDILERYSRRTVEIEEHAKQHNITDAKKKSEIGSKTREAKRADLTPEQQQTNWRGRITETEYKKITSLKNNDSNSSTSANARDAINYSLYHHLERKSVATDKELLTTAMKASIGNATPAQVENQFKQHEGIISIKKGTDTYITTHDALNEEKRLIINANSFKGKFRPINEHYHFHAENLNKQQKMAVTNALSTTNGITIITGKAGTGKTTLMKEVQNGIKQSGKEIYAFAPSAEASRNVQRSEGFENANTVASLIQGKNNDRLKNQVIWIDEAGLLSNKDMNKVMDIAKTYNARLILSGDTRQHNSIERGDALRILQQYSGYQSITVSKIQRQLNADYKEAVKHISDGNIERGFKKLDKMGAIHEIDNHAERIKAVANDYLTSGKNQKVLIVTPTHLEGEQVTQEIRSQLKGQQVLGKTEKQFTSLRNLQYTEAEKSNPENYRAGQVLSFHQNIKGVLAGSKLTIVTTSDNIIHAHDAAGRDYQVSITKAGSYNVFEPMKIEICKGDKIRITGNGRTEDGKHLFNGNTYGVNGFDKQGNIKLSNGSLLDKDYGHFTQGYVITSHSSQGKTADKVIISQSSMTFRAASMEQFYVSVSRGRRNISIYTDDKTSLMEAISKSSQRLSATELVNNHHAEIIKQTQQRIRSYSINAPNKHYELPRTYKTNIQGKGR